MPPREEFQNFSPTILKKIKTRNRTDRHEMTVKLNNDNGLQTRWTRTPAGNSGFAKKRVQWLIEHSTSHQNLWYIDSFVLPCLPAGRETRPNAKPETVRVSYQLLMKQVIECYLTDGRN